MRAIQVSRFGGEDVLDLAELPVPEPAAGQVRVRLRAAGVNPADTYIRTGQYAFFTPPLPYTPGFDGAGVVDAVGPGVTSLAVGERVFVSALGRSTGTYAEHVVADEPDVQPLPDSLSFAQGAAVGVPCATAWRALFQRAALQPGETVLIHGASGGVGIPATQLARDAGATVIGTAGTRAGADLVLAAGAHHVLDHTCSGYLDQLAALAPTVVIEMLADVNLAHDLEIIGPRGRIVVVGSRGSLDFTPRLTMRKEATILGTALWNATPEESAAALRAVGAKLRSGTVHPIVGTELPLDAAQEAHRRILAPGSLGKLVLTM
ncbi:NADPH:quinone reductase [Actinokineospora sp. NPDC004072]